MKYILLATDFHPEVQILDIHSAQILNDVQHSVFTSCKGDSTMLTVGTEISRFDCPTRSVRFLANDPREIMRDPDNMRNLIIVFEDKVQYKVLIQGAKRARHSYEVLQVLLNRPPTEFFMRINQEEDKFALIRHCAVIKELYLTEKIDA